MRGKTKSVQLRTKNPPAANRAPILHTANEASCPASTSLLTRSPTLLKPLHI